VSRSTAASGDLFAVDVHGSAPVQVVADSNFGRVSPDGRWIAYDSSISGNPEVYVRPFAVLGSGAPPAGPVIQISANGGAYPKWRPDGKELFFVGLGDTFIWAAEIDSSNGAFHPATPVSLGLRYGGGGYSTNKTGQRFLLALPLDQDAQTPITVVLNWQAGLKK